MTQKVIVAIKKEIRMTEYQNEKMMHLNVFQEFMLGLQGLMWKHLQSTGKFDALADDITKLAGKIRLET